MLNVQISGTVLSIYSHGIYTPPQTQGYQHSWIFFGRSEAMESKKHVLVIVRIDVKPEMEDDLNRWYDEEHIPYLLSVPGVLWAKRGINTGKGLKYIAIYEHENIDVQHTQVFREAVDTEWTRKIRPHFIKMEREVYELL
jgi:hypothetical protein